MKRYTVRPLLGYFNSPLPGRFGVFEEPYGCSDEPLFQGGYSPCRHFAWLMNKASQECTKDDAKVKEPE